MMRRQKPQRLMSRLRQRSLRLLLLMTMPIGAAAAAAAVHARPTGAAASDRREPQAASGLRVARIFANGMVLQRNQPIVVWGWGAPGTRVIVSIGPGRATATADVRGAWRATLPTMRAGGPHIMRVASDGAQLTFTDVLIGDVWLASGQSNMEFPLSREEHAAREIPQARDTRIRQFHIPTGYAFEPQDSLVAGGWTVADSQHVGDFSAVAYYFARSLRASTGVPIGIVNSTWGGSNIESWISRDAQRISESTWREIAGRQERVRDSVQAALRLTLGTLPTTDAGLVDGRALWAAAELRDDDWRAVTVPGYWESGGLGGLDGVAWYRTEFTLSDADVRAGVTLSMDAIDDDDITWLNGEEIGRTRGYDARRAYRVQSSALRAGRNVLAVRVTDFSGGGGINGAVSITLGDGSRRSLAGQWKLKVASVALQPDGQQINKIPSVLYNQMIRPIEAFRLAGVIWYQGESNANNDEQARAYRTQFQTLIGSWRSTLGAGSAGLPFLWVQLPNFGAPNATPPQSAAWALQRESMEAALALPGTGQAVIIDLGESDDIHPRNKRDVGVRLANVARRVAYGETVEASGPTYRSHVVRGDTIVLSFDHVVAGLRASSRESLRGFAIAGDDRAFVWAQARVEGDRVLVWSERVSAPVSVRYAWSNGPVDLGLVNSLGLPAAPFRTDRW